MASVVPETPQQVDVVDVEASNLTTPPPGAASELEAEDTPKHIVTLDSNGEHLLQSPWTFWFARKLAKTHPTPVNYAEHLQKIATFNTVESFYKTYVYMARPLDLPKDSSLHLFKGDVVPMWESFPNGGEWVIKLGKKHPQLTLLWEELLVYCIGETFEEPDIVGVVLNIRVKEYSLQIWNTDSQNSALRARVWEKLKYYLRLDPSTPLEYKANSASLRSQANEKVSHRNGKVAPAKDKKKKKKKANKAAAVHHPAPSAATPAAATPAPPTDATHAPATASSAVPLPVPTSTPSAAPTANGTA